MEVDPVPTLPPHPTSAVASAITATHAPKARRRPGTRHKPIMLSARNAAHNAARTAKIPMAAGKPHGRCGARFAGLPGNSELDVENVNWIACPPGKPLAGFGVNTQDDFDGVPAQPSVKFRPDPLGA